MRVRCLLGLLLAIAATAAAKNLEISILDVEGGKAVLIVAPSGQSMLFDAGWPSSTERIVEAVKAAGLARIDYLVISHYDIDHIGDLAELSSKIAIGRVFDRGERERPDARYVAYATARERIGHTVVHAGTGFPSRESTSRCWPRRAKWPRGPAHRTRCARRTRRRRRSHRMRKTINPSDS